MVTLTDHERVDVQVVLLEVARLALGDLAVAAVDELLGYEGEAGGVVEGVAREDQGLELDVAEALRSFLVGLRVAADTNQSVNRFHTRFSSPGG